MLERLESPDATAGAPFDSPPGVRFRGIHEFSRENYSRLVLSSLCRTDEFASLLLPHLNILDGNSTPSDERELRPDSYSIKTLSESVLTPSELQLFNKDISYFEKRGGTDKISPEDKIAVYAQVSRLLEASKTGNERFDSTELKTIAKNVLHSAAIPGDVNQGPFPTCTAAALASVLNKQKPNIMATLVADLAISGSYVMNDGTIMTPPAESLKPDKRKKELEHEQTARTMGDHIAQIALLDLHWNKQEKCPGDDNSSNKRGKIFYEEGHPPDTINDLGGRLVDHSTNPPTILTEARDLPDPTSDGEGASAVTLRAISEPKLKIGDLRDIYSQLRGNDGILSIIGEKEDPRTITPKTEEEFKKLLQDGLDGTAGGLRLPALVQVYAKLGDYAPAGNGLDNTATAETNHVVALFDYDPASGLVTVENQWGTALDHTGAPGSKPKMQINKLFKSMRLSDQIKGDQQANKERTPELTAAQWIERQSDFILELQNDGRVKPERIMEEQLTLHKYLKHWKHEDEKIKLEDELVTSLIKRSTIAGRTAQEQTDEDFKQGIELIYTLRASGRQLKASELVASLAKSLEAKTTPPTLEQMKSQSWIQLLALSDATENKIETEKLATTFVGKLAELKLNVSNPDAYRLAKESIIALRALKMEGQAEQFLQHLVKDRAPTYKDGVTDSAPEIEKKAALVVLCDKVNDKLKVRTLASELQQTVDRLKANGDIKSASVVIATQTLAYAYRQLGDVERAKKIESEYNFKSSD